MTNSFQTRLRNPWLVVAWPGPGGVSSIAGRYLAETMGAQPAAAVADRDPFGADRVIIDDGIARVDRAPRNRFYIWRDPGGKRDLVILLGDAQPMTRRDELADRVLDVAQVLGVERVVTLSAMPSDVAPAEVPRVFGAVTTPELLETIDAAAVDRIAQGQVRGLDGSLLIAAIGRSVPAVSLFAEFPGFAVGAPNPRSAAALLDALGALLELEIDMTRLEKEAERVEPQLGEIYSRLRSMHVDPTGDDGEDDDDADDDIVDFEVHQHDEGDLSRVEQMFDAARSNRDRAAELKDELDRLGLFEEYEDRFLDLFK